METFLLQQLSVGNKTAYEYLFYKYQPKLVNFLKGLLHNEDLSYDIAQDIFLSIWNNRAKMIDVQSFDSYLYQMARYKTFDYFNHLTISENFIKEYIATHTEQDGEEEEKLFASEMQRIINEVIAQLPPKCRLVYRMSREEGQSNDEIASRLKISKRTVENYLTYALSSIRKIIFVCILLIIIDRLEQLFVN